MAKTSASDEPCASLGSALFLKLQNMSPSTIFAIFSPLALWYYRRQPVYVRRSPLLWVKVCVAASLFLTELSYHALSLQPFGFQPAIDAMAALLIVGLAYTEHLHSTRSSTLFAIFLVANLFDAVEKWRSSVFSSSSSLDSSLAGMAVALKLAMVALQDVSKRQLIVDAGLRERMGEREASGIFGGLLYSFLKPLLRIGARSAREPEQLRPDLHPRILHQQVMQYWQPELNPDQAGSRRLLIACIKAWKKHLLPMMFSRLAVTALKCAQPFVLRHLIHTVSKQYTDQASIKERLHLLGTVMFLFYGESFAEERFRHFLAGYVTCFRGGLIALQLEKLQRLPDRDAKKAASLSTINSDIDAITTNMSEFIVIPISVVEVGLGSSLLSLFIDAPAAMVCLPIVFAALINLLLARFMVKHVQDWGRNTKSRIASSSRIFHQLTSIKMLGLGPTVCKFMHRLRTAEAKAVLSFQLVNGANSVAILAADFGVPIAALGVAHFNGFFADGAALVNAFPLLTIVFTLKNAIVHNLSAVSHFTSMTGCFSRIEQFLNQPERSDCRLTSNSSPTIQSTPPVGNHVRFAHADIAPSGVKKSVLRRVNFSLARGSITGVVGPPGAGKSLILQAILGRCETLAGSLYVEDTEIGYCGETVWLRDTTIRENIIGHLPYDQARYTRVIQGCFLEEDINWLPDGDQYAVGVNGSSLSDGQRHRIAIARVIYAQHEITLLDDVFRSLDSETAICILHQLCGRNSILRQAGCTVLLVTSLPQCTDVVDQLLFLEGLGTATLDRTYRGPPHAQRVVSALNTLNDLNGNVSVVVEKRHLRAMHRYLQAGNDPAAIPVIQEQRGDVQQLLVFAANSMGWAVAVLDILAVAALSLAELSPEIFLRIWADFYPDDPSFLYGYALCNGSLLLIGPAGLVAHHGIIGPRFWVRVHQMFVTTVTRSTLPFFEMMSIAKLSTIYGEDTIVMAREIPTAVYRLLYAGFEWVFILCIMLSNAKYVGAFLPLIIIAIIVIVRPFLTDSRQTHQLILRTKTAIYAHFEETALGLANIHASHRGETNMANGYRLLADSQRPFYSHLVTFKRGYVGAHLLQASIISVFISISLFAHGAATGISTGHAFFVTLHAPWIFDVAVKCLHRLDIASDTLQRAHDFVKETPLESRNAPSELPQGWPSTGLVEMQNVRAYYTPNVDARPALLDISLTIEPGEHIGIAGRSGSGKSSLLLTLLGFIRYQGSIRIDGVEISSIVPDVLRSHLVTITEEPVIFDGTVRKNLLPFTMNDPAKQSRRRSLGDEQKDLELEQLLKRLHIWVPLINKGGLSANVDEVGYSKGDTQLLCIARAIMRQRETGCKVILIDDATGCLTTHKEKIANDIMSEYFRGCTVLRGSIRESGLEGTGAVAYLHHGVVVDPNEVDEDSELDEEEEP